MIRQYDFDLPPQKKNILLHKLFVAVESGWSETTELGTNHKKRYIKDSPVHILFSEGTEVFVTDRCFAFEAELSQIVLHFFKQTHQIFPTSHQLGPLKDNQIH